MTILRYDRDFEIAAGILPFEHRWVMPCGSGAGYVTRDRPPERRIVAQAELGARPDLWTTARRK
jgi:hypothetical protein